MDYAEETDIDYSLTAEYRLLGSLFIEPRMFDRLDFLKGEHFHSPVHGRIYTLMLENYRHGSPVTNLALMRELDSDPVAGVMLKDAGGAKPYLEGMIKGHVAMARPEEDAKFVVELAQRRALSAACEEALRIIAMRSRPNPAEIAIELAHKFETVSRGFGSPPIHDDYEVTERILEEMKSATAVFPTGIPKLDKCMDGGIHTRKVYGFAARKKCGKSSLGCTLSANLSQANVKHLFVTCEMSAEEVHQRILSRVTDTFPSAFRNPYGHSSDFVSKIVAAARASKRNILYHGAAGISFDQLRTLIVTCALQKGIKGFILDYWQLVGGKKKNQSTSEHLDEVAQWLADACRKYKLFGIVFAQINQTGNTRGSEGIRLAFDQVYELKTLGENGEAKPERWLEMMETRYTKWNNIGSDVKPGLILNEKGPYFEEADEDAWITSNL